MLLRSTTCFRTERMIGSTTHIMIPNCMPLDISAPIIKSLEENATLELRNDSFMRPLIFIQKEGGVKHK